MTAQQQRRLSALESAIAQRKHVPQTAQERLRLVLEIRNTVDLRNGRPAAFTEDRIAELTASPAIAEATLGEIRKIVYGQAARQQEGG